MHATVLLLAGCLRAGLTVKRPVKYPTMDVWAPENPVWTSYFLNGVNIPNIPVNKVPLSDPDWSQDNTRCLNDNDMGLTYDDGPSTNTPATIKILANASISATFFAVGSRVLEYPQTLRDTRDAGHLIGSHTWSHPHLTMLTNGQIVAEIMYSSLIVQDTLGFTPLLFRPPYGDIDARVRAVLKAMGLTIVVWNADSTDSGNPLTVQPMDAVRKWPLMPRIGIITLEHDLSQFEASWIPSVLAVIIGMNVTPKRIDDCLGRDRANSYFSGDLSLSIPDRPTVTLANPIATNLPNGSNSGPKVGSSSNAGALPIKTCWYGIMVMLTLIL